MKKALLIIGILLMPISIFAYSGGIQYLTAPFRGKLSKREKIQASGDFRIYSYEHFFDLCKEIQSNEARYDNQYDLLEKTEKGTEEYKRQIRNVAVIKTNIEELKRQYNADSSKEKTVSAFKENNLPNKINSIHQYGERTNCNY